MQKIFEIIRPKSLTDSSYEKYEYLLRWIGRDGSDYQFMFFDAEIETKVKANTINIENPDTVESLIISEENTINLVAEDLSLNDVDVIGEMFANKYVTRIFKDGSVKRYAMDSNSYKKRLYNLRYNVEFSIIDSNKIAWK